MSFFRDWFNLVIAYVIRLVIDISLIKRTINTASLKKVPRARA